MVAKVRSWLATGASWLRLAWPFVGSLYLGYLALQAPPVRYVGLVGLVFVLPLLGGWVVGRVLGVGPWADATGDHDDTADASVGGRFEDPAETDEPSDGRPD